MMMIHSIMYLRMDLNSRRGHRLKFKMSRNLGTISNFMSQCHRVDRDPISSSDTLSISLTPVRYWFFFLVKKIDLHEIYLFIRLKFLFREEKRANKTHQIYMKFIFPFHRYLLHSNTVKIIRDPNPFLFSPLKINKEQHWCKGQNVWQ